MSLKKIKKCVTCTVVAFFLLLDSKAQGINHLNLVNNKEVNYRIFKTPTRFLDSNKIILSETLVKVLTKQSVRRKISKLKYEDWMRLLDNENTDWAANIWLYDINKKDATILQVYGDRLSWVSCCRLNDIDYWTKVLKH